MGHPKTDRKLPTCNPPWAGIVTVVMAFVLSLPSLAQATFTATLDWDVSRATSLAGYRIYHRIETSGGGILANYSLFADINLNPGPADPDRGVYARDAGTNTEKLAIDNLIEGTVYFFVVTVYDTEGNESAPSNEVSRRTTALTCDSGGTLRGAVIALQVLAGGAATTLINDGYATADCDVTGDGFVGLGEAIYSLQRVAGLR